MNEETRTPQNDIVKKIETRQEKIKEAQDKALKDVSDIINRIADTADGKKFFVFLANQTRLFIPKISFLKVLQEHMGVDGAYVDGQHDLGQTIFNLLSVENYSAILREIKPKEKK
jgi:hypothetical protein